MFRRAAISRHQSLLSLFLLSTPHSSSSNSCRRVILEASRTILPKPPKKIPINVSAHGLTWEDPYHWMRNTDDQDFINHLKRENDYAGAYMADTCTLRKNLIDEMKGRMPSMVSTPPEQWGSWLYYQYIPEGKEYPVLCRKLKASNSNGFFKSALNFMNYLPKEEVLLDWNQIAEQFGYVHIGTCKISPNHKFIAYTLDISGSENFAFYIKDLEKNQIISSFNNKGVVSLAWTGDSQYLFYTVTNSILSQRPSMVFCRKIGGQEEDELIFTENDENYIVDITSTKDFKFITINSNSRSSSEVYVIDSMNIKSEIWRVRKRIKGVQYFMEHHYGFFYILTNNPSDIIGFKINDNNNINGYYLARCRADKQFLDKWEVVLIPEDGMIFQDMDIFHDKLILFMNKNNLPLFCSIDLPIDANIQGPKKIEELNPWFFPVPSNLCNIAPGLNHDFMSTIYRAVLSSPVMPDLTIDYDTNKRKFTILHQDEIKGLFVNKPQHKNMKTFKDLSENFHCERIEVPSHDGVLVPLTIIYNSNKHKSIPTGESSGLLHGYGAYGETLDKSFCSDRLSLLNRGWVLAFADVRGGGGDPSWHKGGTKNNKMNSIYDFAECAKYLINKGLVHKNRLGAIGSSAGGLLVGSTINFFPNLFSSAVLKVPFLDILNTMLDPGLPLTILDYEEFGDPKIKLEFESIHNYSPYDNLRPHVCYPPMLITTSFHDSRVGVWEGAKYVGKAREITCKSCSHNIILKTNMISGHFGEGGRFLQCEDTAFDYAFLIKTLDK